ncbi:Peptidase_C39 like family protein [Saccharopolyspora antimicrobica]|uniref:Peptidase C39-like protein n=1 Tax=Saccharopolyspora antimicrobica TaxID=455193 RepID=A0A1I5GNL7_9PSEU|nr:C39 family peptidase [Saccharopolyspora antimicrobica]RKT87440.1 peptidase C39-like protein [Saccharopolyspora antimicrobica]SFO37527.1 Peptidase_C39 like family protein [Saccharopolyspora antimicrobica]
MQKLRNAGHTPKTKVRALVDKFGKNAGGSRARRVSGKVLPVVVAGGAIVLVGQPLVTGGGSEPEPTTAQIRAVEHEAPLPAPAAAPAAEAPAQAPLPAPQAPPAPALPPAPAPVQVPAPQEPPKPVSKSLDLEYQAQQTSYWCGPTATRIALSSQTADLPDQASLAADLGTTENGTDTIHQIVDGLNEKLGDKGGYVARDWSDKQLTPELTDQLWSDIVRNIDQDKAMVANIVATPGNQPPGYPSGQTIYHYVTIAGYDAENKTVHIADPANFSGIEDYWLSLDQLASLIKPKGYTA